MSTQTQGQQNRWQAPVACWKNILRGEAKLRHQSTNLRDRFRQLIAPGFVDLLLKGFALLQEFFVAGHGV